MAFAPRTQKKPLSILEKKIPTNPRYAKICSVIDTGAKVKGEIVLSDKVIARRRGELFSRISVDGLAELLSPTTSDECIYTPIDTESPTVTVVHLEDVPPSNIAPKNLILDTREEDEFRTCHITGSIHYPLQKIVRGDISINLHMMRLKQPGKHLVVYGLDDKYSIPAGTCLAQKGWEEVLVLSGGLEEFAIKYPGLVTGSLPLPVKLNKAHSKSGSTRSYASSEVGSVAR
jgi:centrosomal protein CEP41